MSTTRSVSGNPLRPLALLVAGVAGVIGILCLFLPGLVGKGSGSEPPKTETDASTQGPERQETVEPGKVARKLVTATSTKGKRPARKGNSPHTWERYSIGQLLVKDPEELIRILDLPRPFQRLSGNEAFRRLIARHLAHAKLRYQELFSNYGEVATQIASQLAKENNYEPPPKSYKGRVAWSSVNGKRVYILEKDHPEIFVIRKAINETPQYLRGRIIESATKHGFLR